MMGGGTRDAGCGLRIADCGRIVKNYDLGARMRASSLSAVGGLTMLSV